MFGVGLEEAREILRTDAAARRIYDCAMLALEEAEREAEIMAELPGWLDDRIASGGQGDGFPLEMDPLYAKGRISAFEATRRFVSRFES